MTDTPPPGYIVVGKIAGVFGIKGWVKLYSYTQPRANISQFSGWYRQAGDGRVEPLPLDEFKAQGKAMVAHIRGIDDREQALALRQQLVLVAADELPALPEGEYYWHQLEGLRVTVAGQLLGRVDHLIETGANDVLVVAPCEGSIDQRERLLPYLPGQVVLAVDTNAGEIQVDWDPDF